MSHQQPLQTMRDVSVEKEAPLQFMTDSHRVALDGLDTAFAEARPLAVLIGKGVTSASFVIGSFLGNIEGDVAVVRIKKPCSDSIAGMREVIRGIGFDPKDMNLADLENVFRMFLVFQKTHHRRTIICFEDAQDIGQWVLDRVRHLVELETKGKFGLMVVLSGGEGLHELLDHPPLNVISKRAGRRIVLAPFTLTDTREYIRRRVEAAGNAEIDQMFEFDAVTEIHELSEGIADAISNIYSQCLELAEKEDTIPVTAELVKRVDRLSRLPSVVQDLSDEGELGEVTVASSSHGRLVVFMNDTITQEQTLGRGHVLIGRDELCDMRLDNAAVSRHHALVLNSSNGISILDLASTNGVFLNNHQIKQHILQDSDEITIGDCTIKYVAGDDHQSRVCDTDATRKFEPSIADLKPPDKDDDGDTQLPDSARTRILRVLGRDGS